MRTSLRIARLAPACLLLAGCAVGPRYERPAAPVSAEFKEARGWVIAAPADTLERGPWWELFGDPLLNRLAERVEVSNQNIAAFVAAYAQARALVREQRAALFPIVTLSGEATRGGATRAVRNSFHVDIGSSWEPDVWGRLRAGVESAVAGAQASQADLAAARLSAQGELAFNYFSLRQLDAQRGLFAGTIQGYLRVLQITQNRFDAGIAARSDVLQAQTQLANAQNDELTVVLQRAQFEHAIAILLGLTPAEFSLAPAPWQVTVPDIPLGVPSTLLQRRPDIAAAERRVAEANANIGIERAAWFPSIGLSASYGSTAPRVGDLFSAPTTLWSLGTTVVQTVFNAGATRARVEGAEAQYQQTVAQYRQTVLNAFGDVEDQLAATGVLAQQQEFRREASEAADLNEKILLNQYKEGFVSYTDVVIAQASALAARRALVQVQADRQNAAVALIQSLGGGWHVP